MRKKLPKEEHPTRAKKREIKKRPRMRVRGAGLKKPRHQAGLLLKHGR